MLNKLRLTAAGRIVFLIALLILPVTIRMFAQTDQTVYADSLQNGWSSYGWATLNFTNPAPTYSGSYSISVTSSGYQALYLHHNAQAGGVFSNLTFWINGGSGGQIVQVQATSNGVAQAATVLAALPVDSWRLETISMKALGVANITAFDGFWIQSQSAGAAPTFYVDDLTLITNSSPPAAVTLTSPTSGAGYSPPATIPLAAIVTTNGHAINKVQFYNGTTLLGEDLIPPYLFTWTNVGVGSYALTARVTFDFGTATAGTADSAPVVIAVVSNTPVAITVDAGLNQRPINPLIYGVAFGGASELADLNAPLNRSGGNSETRYNWLINAHNRAADFYFESLADAPATAGAAADSHVSASKSGGAEPVLTVSMIGWMPKLGASRGKLASYSIAKYGAQTGRDAAYMPDAGNGIGTNLSTQSSWLITTNDPTDANFPTNSVFQREFIKHLTNAFGLSTNGGVRFYCMDNEHALWNSTHRDVHPVGTTMTEIRDKIFDYGAQVKAIDPNALLLAPEEWGWPGYLYSGYDWQWAGAHNDYTAAHFPDRSTNGGMDYGPWLLDQMRQYELTHGQRLLDVFTLHIYPQGANESGNDVSTSTQLARNRSTRALWDPSYVDQSWINSVIKLIPRMRDWVAAYYPGTKIGITEYNWGAENHINGATAQADLLGIFGREGLDLATRWTIPGSNTPAYQAMKMYRNYDGNKATFGDTSVFAGGPNPDNVACFASKRSSDGAVTIMVINKQIGTNASVNLSLTNFLPAGSAQVWQLTAANSISHLTSVAFSGSSFSNTLPAQSITLFVVPGGTPPSLRAVGASGGNFHGWLDGQAGQRYAILSSSNLVDWQYVQTNTLVSNSVSLTLAATNALRFYRAQWLP